VYFLPRNNKFYSFIVHLKPNYRYGLSLLVCGIFALVWMLAIHMPLQYSMSHATKEIKHLNSQCALCDQATGACASLATMVESMKVEVNKHIVDISQNTQDALLFVINQAHRNNLAILGCTIDGDVDQQWYVEHAITFDVEGDFKNLMKFFESIKGSSHLIAIKQYNLARANETSFSLKGVLGVIEAK
jgi:Tfp pilus assembly protein PilO